MSAVLPVTDAQRVEELQLANRALRDTVRLLTEQCAAVAAEGAAREEALAALSERYEAAELAAEALRREAAELHERVRELARRAGGVAAAPAPRAAACEAAPLEGGPINGNDGHAVSEDALPALEALRERGLQLGWLLDAADVRVHADRLLGEGTFARTYRATFRGAPAAAKCVALRRGREREDAESFARECAALAAARHPRVCAFLGAVVEPAAGRLVLVLELLEGGSLAEWVHGRRGARHPPPWPLLRALRLARDVAAGMSGLEARRICHRDLKPSNVLLSAPGAGGQPVAKVADAGLARLLDDAAAGTLTPETGSYLYMSPEMVRHEEYNSSSDVWSFGCLFVELLTSQRPYGDAYMTPVQIALAVGEGGLRPPTPPALLAAAAGGRLAELLDLTFKLDPAERPTFAQWALALEAAVQQMEAEAAEAARPMAAAGLVSSAAHWLGPLFARTTTR